jgi:hypothetical protein
MQRSQFLPLTMRFYSLVDKVSTNVIEALTYFRFCVITLKWEETPFVSNEIKKNTREFRFSAFLLAENSTLDVILIKTWTQ